MDNWDGLVAEHDARRGAWDRLPGRSSSGANIQQSATATRPSNPSGQSRSHNDPRRQALPPVNTQQRWAPYPAAASPSAASPTTPGLSSARPNPYIDERRRRSVATTGDNRPARRAPPDLTGLSQYQPPQPRAAVPNPYPVQWSTPYWLHLSIPKTGRADNSDLMYHANKLQSLIPKCVADGEGHPYDGARLKSIREALHELEGVQCNSFLVKVSELLNDNKTYCLAQLFAGQRQFPHDIRADAKALVYKWENEDFDPDILRGLKRTGARRQGWSVDKDYPGYKERPYEFGEQHLVNGQWWPLRVCLMRDRAHGMPQAGIHGRPGVGAYSVVVAEGGYADIDEGDRILYCGTQAREGEDDDTANTQLLADSVRNRERDAQGIAHRRPVRVFRTENMPKNSRYRPERGIRYDGLYYVTESMQLDKGMKRFTLERLPGQDPIRANGPAARPTEQEIRRCNEIRS